MKLKEILELIYGHILHFHLVDVKTVLKITIFVCLMKK